ncbi:MAG: hypothetical protein ACFFC7_06025 [Candidatus Hermodarchaeota archaeon]
MDQDSIIFIPAYKKATNCPKCQACVRSCPAGAITWKSLVPNFDISKCVSYQKLQSDDEEECLECVMSCRKGLIRLQRFSETQK